MGVQGLTTMLQSTSRPQMVTRLASDARRSGEPDILLVDANNVKHYIMNTLAASSLEPSAGADFHAALYRKAVGFYAGITQQSGLRCVLVSDGSWSPGAEADRAARRRNDLVEGTGQHGTVDMVLAQAYKDLGLQVERSIHSADELLLAWYHRNASQVFAVLTNDSDFFIYGVQRIVHVNDIVIDNGSVTFHLWNVNECWIKWQQAAAAKSGAHPPMVMDRNRTLKRRAQVAAILGNDTSKSIRRRLADRRLHAKQTAAFGCFPSAAKAAREVLLHATGELTVEFFRREPLSLKAFDDSDLEAFNAQVQEYIAGDAAARAPNAVEQLSIGPDALPWMAAPLLKRLREAVVPRLLLALAGRGIGSLTVPNTHWVALQAVRWAAAQKLGAPAALFEYCAGSNTLHQLTATPASPASPGPCPQAQWFDPAKHLPGVKLVDSTAAPAGAIPAAGASLEATLAALKASFPGLPETLAQFGAILLHAIETPAAGASEEEVAAAEAAYASAVRALLLPGMPSAAQLQIERAAAAAAAAEARVAEEEAERAAAAAAESVMVPVGSELSKKDWEDIDAADVVAKARSSAGFHLMTKLQPYEPLASAASLNVPRHDLFLYFYQAADQDGVGQKIWSKLLKSLFAAEYEAAKEGDKAAVKAKHKENMAAAKELNMRDPRVKAWLDRLKAFADTMGTTAAAAPELLALRRDASQYGPSSLHWQAAKVCWGIAAGSVKQQVLADMWGWGSASGTSLGLPPMRHPHQQELLDLVHAHLLESEQQKSKQPTLPLQIVFSTPTGSGKTFSAVMMNMHLLQPRPNMTQYGEGHKDTIVLYSVPTKQVLKKVGQDCEAHRVVYWTAAKDGDLFQVRRPYSIRSQRGGGATGSGSMKDQLELAETNGRKLNDIGGGQPAFIVADVHSTAAILRAAAEASPDDFYHRSKLVLYFDEPTMGIHFDRGLMRVVKDIMRNAPLTTILASATMPNWDQLPAWWKGRGSPATRTVISLEPYSLPNSRLKVMNLADDGTSGSLTPINLFQLVPDVGTLHQQVALRPRLGVLLLRHLAPNQANQLLLDLPKPVVDSAVADADGWDAVEQDVASLRQAIGPRLQELDSERFESLREQWAEPAQKLSKGWADVISHKGVTMVATLDPRRLALEIAGKWRDPEGWDASVKDLRSRIKVARAAQRQQAKESQRSQKKTDDDVPAIFSQASSGGVSLRKGLEVTVDQAEQAEDDLLVMLSKGVAFACCNDTDPLVMRLYQQALLWIPDRVSVTPSINVLVVDYSSIYGTDCTSVDTIVMCKDLGEHLSWEDHQQFIGRLRRDGTAIYPSWSMLCYATTGVHPSPAGIKLQLQVQTSHILKSLAAPQEGSDGAGASAEASRKLRELRRGLDPASEVLTAGDVAGAVLGAVLTSLVEPPVGAAAPAPALSAVQLYKEAVTRLSKWGTMKPVSLMAVKAAKDQACLVDALQRVCYPPAAVSATGLATVGGGAFPAIGPKLLQWLYEADVLGEDAMKEWVAGQGASAASPFMDKVVKPFMTWLQEAEEEEDDEDDDDAEEGDE